MQKARNIWQAIEQKSLFNPLNIEPTVRPPGTALMSYPFGFSADFHGFHFRSVFFPILCVVAAVYIVAGSIRSKVSGWWVTAITLLFSSLPMFYHFDYIEDTVSVTQWGCVDNFLAGIAAIAAAAVVRSLLSKSLTWLLFASLMAAFTLLIKPSGLMVMALVALTWFIIVALEWLQLSRRKVPDSSFWAYSVKGGALILGPYVCVSSLCFFSGYLSSSNFTFAKQALVTMREVRLIDFQLALLLFHHSSGEALLLWIIGVGALSVYWLTVARQDHAILLTRVCGLLMCSLVIWMLGAWYWLMVQAGGSAVRYFYPFMLMGAVYIIPAALFAWQYTNRLIRFLLIAICIIPALNIASLMVAGDTPSMTWQRSTGVSVSVATDREIVQQAHTFFDELRKTKKNVQIYFFSTTIPPMIFENVGLYEETARPEPAFIRRVLPIDWLRGFAVRLEELLDSDYILIRKYGGPDVSLLAANKFDSFASEAKAFELWLATLNEKSGVEVASDGRTLRVLHIADRRALNRALDAFVSAHSWRREFVVANQPMWWSAETVSAYTGIWRRKKLDLVVSIKCMPWR